jgi:hypothetical protein
MLWQSSPRRWNEMMQKSTTFTTIFRIKKYYFHYDFACKKVLLSLRYAKNNFFNSSYNYWHWTYCSNGLQYEQMNYYSAKKPKLVSVLLLRLLFFFRFLVHHREIFPHSNCLPPSLPPAFANHSSSVTGS